MVQGIHIQNYYVNTWKNTFHKNPEQNTTKNNDT